MSWKHYGLENACMLLTKQKNHLFECYPNLDDFPAKARAKKAFLFNYHTTWLYSLLSHMVFYTLPLSIHGNSGIFQYSMQKRTVESNKKKFNCKKINFIDDFCVLKWISRLFLGRKIPDIEEVLREVRHQAWKTPKSQRSRNFLRQVFLFELFIGWMKSA